MRHVLAVLAAGALIATSPTAHAGPTVDGPTGRPCHLADAQDPGAEGDVRTGEVDAGPLVVGTDVAGGPQGGFVTCTVQVGGSHHADPDNGAKVRAGGSSVVVIWPSAVSYPTWPNVPIYLCTEFTYYSGLTLYWKPSNDPTADGSWTTDPSQDCEIVTFEDIPVADLVDPVACPVTGSLAPGVPGVVDVDPNGSVSVAGLGQLRNCPPYYDPLVVPPVGPPHVYVPTTAITIRDDGAGPVWTATGDLADGTSWNCYRDASSPRVGVTCEWVGGVDRPSCVRAGALAVALPSPGGTWGTERTTTICEGNLLAEWVQSGTANGPVVQYAERDMVFQYLTKVYCTADDGNDGAPLTRYLAECTFTF